MDRSSRFDAAEESSYQVLWEEGERVGCRGWRLYADGDRGAVLTLRTAGEHTTSASGDRLAHEYELNDELDRAWAGQPLALERGLGRPMLVLEDPGGDFLEGLLGRPMPVALVLRLALG